MVDEFSGVGISMVGWRVQEFGYAEVCIDVVAHCGFVTRGVDFGVVEDRGRAGHVGIVSRNVHRRLGRREMESCRWQRVWFICRRCPVRKFRGGRWGII